VPDEAWVLPPWARARLDGVRVVLVATSHPGNVGAVARAMKTMGLGRLHLVAPAADHRSEAAVARASGADDLLAAATVHADLDAAVAACGQVVGASARLRNLPWPGLDPRAAAERLVRLPAQTEVALVFGRERSGLSNAELERCNALLHIPAEPGFSSLNLAAAVQICAYELRMALLTSGAPVARKDLPASAAALAGLHGHLQRVLLQSGFLDPARPGRVMRRLRRLLARAGPERIEVDILRGILTAVEACMSDQRSGQRDTAEAPCEGCRRPKHS